MNYLQLYKCKPTTNGQRNRVYIKRTKEVNKEGYAPLLTTIIGRAGRNNKGRITVRHRKNPQARRVKNINWYFKPSSYTVERVDYDSRRLICALVRCNEGKLHYIPMEESLKIGDKIDCESNQLGSIKKLKHIPKNTDVCLISNPARNHKVTLIRTPGSFAKLRSIKEDTVVLLYPSGQLHEISSSCYATIGRVVGSEKSKIKLGKASASHLIGRRSSSRGIAMNAQDHPNGGSYHNKGRQSRSPTGILAKGGKTRSRTARKTLIKKKE